MSAHRWTHRGMPHLNSRKQPNACFPIGLPWERASISTETPFWSLRRFRGLIVAIHLHDAFNERFGLLTGHLTWSLL
jgi:hypothetical protein